MNRTKPSVFKRFFRTNAILVAVIFLLIYLFTLLFFYSEAKSAATNQQKDLLSYMENYINTSQHDLQSSVDIIYGDLFTLNDLCAYMNLESGAYSSWRIHNLSGLTESSFKGKEGFFNYSFQKSSSLKYLTLYGFSRYRMETYDTDYAKGPVDRRRLGEQTDNRFLEFRTLTQQIDQETSQNGIPVYCVASLLNNTLSDTDAATMAVFLYDLGKPAEAAFQRYGRFDGSLAVLQNGIYKTFAYKKGKPLVFAALTEAEYQRDFASRYTIYSRTEGDRTGIISGVSKASFGREFGRQALLLLATALLLAGGALFLIRLLMAKSQRRMDVLLDGIDRVKQGDLTFRIDCGNEGDDIQLISEQFNQMCDQLSAYIKRTYEAQIETKNAQFLALETQINPHFLYNTLEIIRMKAAENHDSAVQEMIYSLVSLYRSIVREETFIPIEREIEYIKSFISLLKFAYEDTEIESCIDVEPELLSCPTVKFILQPIIENFFVHSVVRGKSGNTMLLLVYEEVGDIVFRIENIGNPISPEKVDDINHVLAEMECLSSKKYIGIANVHQRIRGIYGPPYGVRLKCSEDYMPVYLLRIPKTEGSSWDIPS